jgi:hypothetical protein
MLHLVYILDASDEKKTASRGRGRGGELKREEREEREERETSARD